MSRVTKTTAYTGAVLALALTLTGCNGGGQPSGDSTSASASQSSLAPIDERVLVVRERVVVCAAGVQAGHLEEAGGPGGGEGERVQGG